MIWSRLLFRMFLELVEAANKGNLVTFEGLHDEITKNYKTLDVEQQGSFHQLVSNWSVENGRKNNCDAI